MLLCQSVSLLFTHRNSFNGSLCLNNAELGALLLNLVQHLLCDRLIYISQCLSSFFSLKKNPLPLPQSFFFFLYILSSKNASCSAQCEVRGRSESRLSHWASKHQRPGVTAWRNPPCSDIKVEIWMRLSVQSCFFCGWEMICACRAA